MPLVPNSTSGHVITICDTNFKESFFPYTCMLLQVSVSTTPTLSLQNAVLLQDSSFELLLGCYTFKSQAESPQLNHFSPKFILVIKKQTKFVECCNYLSKQLQQFPFPFRTDVKGNGSWKAGYYRLTQTVYLIFTVLAISQDYSGSMREL